MPTAPTASASARAIVRPLISGAAGEVVFVEVIGSVLAWGSNYRLERADAAESRQRAVALRLVADVG